MNNVISTYIGTGVVSAVIYVSYQCYKLYTDYRKIISDLQDKICENVDNVKVYDHYIDITYFYFNKMYQVKIPFDRTKVVDMTQYMVIGKDNEGNEVELTQQPGIPYLLCPNEVNLASIEVYDLLNDTVKTYHGEDIPMYG